MKLSSADAFRAQAENWKRFFSARVTVALAIREDREWRLWYAYTAFVPELAGPVDAFTIETASIRACREVERFDTPEAAEQAIWALLENPGSVQTTRWTAQLSRSTNSLSYEYEQLHPERFAGPKRLPALKIESFNTQYVPFEAERELDQELQLNAIPFDGYADLASSLNIPVSFDQLNRRRTSEIVLLSPMEVLWEPTMEPKSSLNNGLLSLVIKSHPAIPVEQVKIGVRAFKQVGAAERFTINGSTISRTGEHLHLNHRLPGPSPLVQIFVSLKGDLIGKWWIRDFGSSFNDRMLLHRGVDTQGRFRSTFFDRPEQFEDRVLLLLTLIGLTSLKYGKIETEAPDILAVSSERHVFIVECTTGDINSRGKLQRLAERASAIAERLGGSTNPPVGVVPVMVTSLPRRDTAMHWDTAATFGIAVVAKENVAGLLDVLDAPISLADFYSATLSLIPPKREQPQPEEGSSKKAIG